MKSIHLHVSALLLACTLATNVCGQDNPSQILARGQVASLPVDAAGDRIRNQTGPSAFPSLSPSRERTDSAGSGTADNVEKNELAGPAITVTSSLVVVLGLFAGLVWLTRRFGSRGISAGAIPKEVFQSLGSTPLDARTTITMIRCGNRIVVMARGATGIHPLTEITDPDEVRQLTAACLGDSKQAFASALRSVEQEKTQPGYVGSQASAPKTRARGRLFATA